MKLSESPDDCREKPPHVFHSPQIHKPPFHPLAAGKQQHTYWNPLLELRRPPKPLDTGSTLYGGYLPAQERHGPGADQNPARASRRSGRRFLFSRRLPHRVFGPSELFITGHIHHLQSELSLLVCRRSCACHFIRPCGKDRIQKGVLREVIDERNNHIAENKRPSPGPEWVT